MNFLANPNLPSGSVKAALCDCRMNKEIITELNTLGVQVLLVPEVEALQKPVSAHPDMLVCHLGNGDFLVSQEYCEIFTNQIAGLNIDCELFNNSVLSKKLSSNYPRDVLLNCVKVGEYLICNKSTVAEEVFEHTNKRIIQVKQGYTKCSTCIVSKDAIITDDMSIKNAAEKFIDVLYVEHGQVMLKGYSYGFIGGCSGKLSNDILAFSGNLKDSKYYESINSFCRNHGVYCMSLSNHPLYDYGSILPITEE